MYGPHDALDLLYKAATDGPQQATVANNMTPQTDISQPPPIAPVRVSHPVRPAHTRTYSSAALPPIDPRLSQSIDPTLEKSDGSQQPDLSTVPGYAEALKVWSRFRFVRAGWFTAHEAIAFID